MEDMVDLLINECDAAELAGVLEAVVRHLGELSPEDLNAFHEVMVARGECPKFDAGIDLLDGSMGDPSR